MNPEIKKDWVAELRSGKYEQGANYLHNIDQGTYCCLGVLCKMATEAGVTRVQATEGYMGVGVAEYGDGTYAPTQAVLPKEVQGWAGLDGENPIIEGVDMGEAGDSTSLAYMNDHGATFAYIADLIEENL
jgi:hypothetical protein